MKTLKIGATFILLGTLCIAADIAIDAQINEIQNAPAQDRVKLMNQLKIRLSELNKEDRAVAMDKLRSKLQTKEQRQISERSRLNQMGQTENIRRNQNMQQHQAIRQAVQQGATNSGTANKFMGRK